MRLLFTNPRIWLAAALGLSPLTLVGNAAAQSVDYGALEQLFGEPVTTSATGRPQKVSEAPANMVIITQDDIRRSGAANIPDVLRFVTGLDVRRYGSVDADVAVRGYNQAFNPRLLVMVNGRQVYLDSQGFVAWQLIPVQLEEIRQIEVVKGPSSALFGFNAASGVINIITYDPLYDHVESGTFRLGSQNLLEGSAVATVHDADHDAGMRISLGGLRQTEYRSPGESPALAAVTRDPALGSFNFDGKARIAPGVEVMFEASTATSQNTDISIDNLPAFDTFHADSFRAGVTADTRLGLISVNAWRNWFGTSTDSVFIGSSAAAVSNPIYVLQASDTLQLNTDHIIRVGLEYRDNSATSAQIFGGTIGYSDYSVSGMWDWRITPALSLTNSVRVDYLALRYSGVLPAGDIYTNAEYNNATILQPSFNLGLVYRLTGEDTLRLTAGRGLQAPSLIDFAVQFPASPLQPASFGSPFLRPTAVWNLELDYDRDVPAIASEVRGTIFVQRNDNLLDPGAGELPTLLPTGLLASIAQNIGHSDAVGGEISITGHSPSGFRWNASYSVMGIADHTSIDKVLITSPQNYQDGTPTNVVVLGGALP